MSAVYDKEELRRLRGAWGWGLFTVWMVLWWVKLDAGKREALARPCPESLTHAVGDFFAGAGETCKAGIEGGFWTGVLAALLVSPVVFIVAHHIAKWRVASMAAAEAARETRLASEQEQKRQQAHACAIADMGATAQREEQAARQANDRYELITRLGAVDDQLLILADETDGERIRLIKLNLAQALRDIHAKFSDEELRAYHAQDEGIARRVARTLAEMRKLKLTRTRLYDDLASMFAMPDAGPDYGAALPAAQS